MRKNMTPREKCAAQLRRLEIEDLCDEYRRVFGLEVGASLPFDVFRETMMRGILEREFGEEREVPARPGWFSDQ